MVVQSNNLLHSLVKIGIYNAKHAAVAMLPPQMTPARNVISKVKVPNADSSYP